MNNPLLCDPAQGACEITTDTNINTITSLPDQEKAIRIHYFTDPICSACWGIEPQLRKLKLEYGNFIEISYHMGGLLPSWDGFNGGGISKPSDVAQHWQDASAHYEMPIDGGVWLTDPLNSSYPPSIAFKAAQLQSESMAIALLRRLREMVFIENVNIAKMPFIEQGAQEVGLHVDQLRRDYDGPAQQLFQDDLVMTHSLGVRGFPTVFFQNNNRQEQVYGFRPYAFFEQAVVKLLPTVSKNAIIPEWEPLFAMYPTLTTKEFSVLNNLSVQESKTRLHQLFVDNKLLCTSIKNGELWRLKVIL